MDDHTTETASLSPEARKRIEAMGMEYAPPSPRQSGYQVSPWLVDQLTARGIDYVPPVSSPVRRALDPGFDAPPSAMPRDPYFDIPSTLPPQSTLPALPPQSKPPVFQVPGWWDYVQQQPPTGVHPRTSLPRQS